MTEMDDKAYAIYYESWQRETFGVVPGTRVPEVSAKTDNGGYSSYLRFCQQTGHHLSLNAEQFDRLLDESKLVNTGNGVRSLMSSATNERRKLEAEKCQN